MNADEPEVPSYAPFTVYDFEGRILRTGTAPEYQAQFQAIESQGEWLLLSSSNINSDYVVGGKVVPLPPKPSDSHVFNYAERLWVDPRTLDDLKADKWAEIRLARDAADFSGFAWQGHTFDSDQVSQGRITGAVQLAQLDPSFSIIWTLADNTVIELDAVQMQAVGAALGAHVSAQHALARQLRKQINAATKAAQLAGIHWSTSIV